MNISPREEDELIYLVVFIIFLNVLSAAIIFFCHLKPSFYVNPKYFALIYFSGTVAIITSISLFYVENLKFSELIDNLASQVNSLESNLEFCFDFSVELNEYELQSAIRAVLYAMRDGIVFGYLFLYVVTSFLLFMFYKFKNYDFFWLILVGLVISSFIGGVAIASIDVFDTIKSTLEFDSSAVSKFRTDCIDPDFKKIYDQQDPNSVDYCETLIEYHSCKFKDSVEEIIHFDIHKYAVIAWAAGVVPPLFYSIFVTFAITTQHTYTPVDKTETPEATKSLF